MDKEIKSDEGVPKWGCDTKTHIQSRRMPQELLYSNL